MLAKKLHQVGQTPKKLHKGGQGQDGRFMLQRNPEQQLTSETIQALIKACIYRGDSGIKMEMPAQPHKTAQLPYNYTSSNIQRGIRCTCAAEADYCIVWAKSTITRKRRRTQLCFLEERSVTLPPISCPLKSATLQANELKAGKQAGPAEVTDPAEASVL